MKWRGSAARSAGRVDVVIANQGQPSNEALARYAAEHKHPLEIGDLPAGTETVIGEFWRSDIARHERQRLSLRGVGGAIEETFDMKQVHEFHVARRLAWCAAVSSIATRRRSAQTMDTNAVLASIDQKAAAYRDVAHEDLVLRRSRLPGDSRAARCCRSS